jgi:hypothetical protein
MKHLITFTTIIEIPTGLALLIVPAVVVKLLLGAEISGAGIPLGRIAGLALLALGVACWLVRGNTHDLAAKGLVTAMLLYNLGTAAVLGVAGIQLQPVGIALWPAVLLHAVMGIWCIRVVIVLAKKVPR